MGDTMGDSGCAMSVQMPHPCPSVCLSVPWVSHVAVCLPVPLSVCPTVRPVGVAVRGCHAWLSVCLSVLRVSHVAVCLSVPLSVCPTVHPVGVTVRGCHAWLSVRLSVPLWWWWGGVRGQSGFYPHGINGTAGLHGK